MKLSGHLGAYELADLVTILEQLQFQGTLRLLHGSEHALFVFDADRVYFPLPAPPARQRWSTRKVRERAERSLERICGWTRVEFDTHPNRLPPPAEAELRVSGTTLARLCAIPNRRRQLAFCGPLSGSRLPALGVALREQACSGVLLVDDGGTLSSVFYDAGIPYRRSGARGPRNSRGGVFVRFDSGARAELFERPERFRLIRQGWTAA